MESEELRARSALYRMFGALLYREVSVDWLRMFQQELRPQWEEAGCRFEADMDADAASLKEALDAEFTTLWIAPGGVARYESIFETGAVFQGPCDQVAAVYAGEGFHFDMDAEKSFPDHAGVELEFLGFLLARQAEAVDRGDAAEANRLGGEAKNFLRQHPGKWVPAMMQLSMQLAEHSFYRELCRMVFAFLDQEIEAMLPRRDREALRAKYQRMPKELDYDADFRKASGL